MLKLYIQAYVSNSAQKHIYKTKESCVAPQILRLEM